MLASTGLPGLLVIAFVILLLFGRGRFAASLEDLGRGVKSLRRAMPSDPDLAVQRLPGPRKGEENGDPVPPGEQAVEMTRPLIAHAGSSRKPRLAASLAIASLAIASLALPGQGLAQSASQPGHYTIEQALRGEKAFLGNCVGCHGYSMSSIFSRYRNAYIYWGKISSTMPWEDAGNLAPQDYIDMVAYMMRENGFPPGDVELKVDRPLLESIIPPRAGMK